MVLAAGPHQSDARARDSSARVGATAGSPSSASSDLALANLIDHLTERLAESDSFDADAFLAEYPQHADRLRPLLPALRTLAQLNRSSTQARSASEGSRARDHQPGDSQQHALEFRPSSFDLRPSFPLGDFLIQREIGRGGMGIVYEAEQISLRRRVALKVLPFASTLDDRSLARFKNEAQAAASLHHPNIVPIYSVGCEHGLHFYAMQFIDGHSLAEVIDSLKQQSSTGEIRGNREKQSTEASQVSKDQAATSESNPLLPLLPFVQSVSPPSAANLKSKIENLKSADRFRFIARLGCDAALALQHAHDLGIIHRDIKPANLLLDRDGKLWITDFGLARIAGSDNLTMSGDLLGTLRYMSPEQALGSHTSIDHRTDIYSLGATLYELLTGEPLITATDRGQIIRELADQQPLLLRKLPATVPTDLGTIILKATTRQPAYRHASAQELANDLQRFLDGAPITGRRPRGVGLRPDIPLALAVVFILIIAIAASLGYALRDVPPSGEAAAVREGEAPAEPFLASSVIDLQPSTSDLDSTSPTPHSSPTPIPPPPGLVAWWSGDGHSNDDVGTNHGTLKNGAGFAPGLIGQAFSLDGSDDYVRVPHSEVFNFDSGFTIECWFRSNSTAGPRTLVSKWDDDRRDWSFLFKDFNFHDKLHFDVRRSTAKTFLNISGGTNITVGNWIHAAATFDNKTARIYFNGALDCMVNATPEDLGDSHTDVLIGAIFGNGDLRDYFHGLIDEVCIYNRGLTSAEIQAIYRAGEAGKIKPATHDSAAADVNLGKHRPMR